MSSTSARLTGSRCFGIWVRSPFLFPYCMTDCHHRWAAAFLVPRTRLGRTLIIGSHHGHRIPALSARCLRCLSDTPTLSRTNCSCPPFSFFCVRGRCPLCFMLCPTSDSHLRRIIHVSAADHVKWQCEAMFSSGLRPGVSVMVHLIYHASLVANLGVVRVMIKRIMSRLDHQSRSPNRRNPHSEFVTVWKLRAPALFLRISLC
jgi:hypothetical protein